MGGDRAKFVISVVPRSTRDSKKHPWLCLGCLLAALRREGCRDVDGTIPQTVGLHTVQVDKEKAREPCQELFHFTLTSTIMD